MLRVFEKSPANNYGMSNFGYMIPSVNLKWTPYFLKKYYAINNDRRLANQNANHIYAPVAIQENYVRVAASVSADVIVDFVTAPAKNLINCVFLKCTLPRNHSESCVLCSERHRSTSGTCTARGDRVVPLQCSARDFQKIFVCHCKFRVAVKT